MSSSSGVAANMPEAEVVIDEGLVRRVLEAAVEDQNLDPSLASQPLKLEANGWDNVMYRLGDHHLVRLPRRQVAVPLVEHEQRWLPGLARRLPIPIPVPVFSGRPVDGERVTYQWPWSIVPWFEGEPLGPRNLTAAQSATLASELAAFLHALHAPSPTDAPANPFRGVPLSTRADRTLAYLESGSAAMRAVGSAELADRIRDRWHEALAASEWQRQPRWLHGDLHALNMVWHDDHLGAVIDFGDITGGDPATDLALAWSLFPDPDRRRQFQDIARIDGAAVDVHTWSRARGWALGVAAAIVTRSADNPTLFQLGSRTLQTVAEDMS